LKPWVFSRQNGETRVKPWGNSIVMVYIIKPLVETMEPLMKVRKVAPILGLMGGFYPKL
jgi:hypothetical protein